MLGREEMIILNDIRAYLRCLAIGMGIDPSELPAQPKRVGRKLEQSRDEYEADLRLAKGIGEHDWNLPFKSSIKENKRE